MKKNVLTASAFMGLTAVILGAMGAHSLEKVLDGASLNSFETGVRYQMFHALALLGLAAFATSRRISPLLAWTGRLWITGVVLFSGSIYLLSTRELTGWELSWLGPVTPVGGLILITGWLLLLIYALKPSSPEEKNKI